jgi:hypothetical protein
MIQKRSQKDDSLEEEIEEFKALHLQIVELLQEFIS